MPSALIAGGGFRGIVSACLLLERGFQVTLVEQAPFLGAVLWPFEWKEQGLFLDKGCHLFGSGDPENDRIVLAVLGDNLRPVDMTTAGVFNGKVSAGWSVPDLTALDRPVADRILHEMVAIAARSETGIQTPPKTLADRLVAHFGPTAAAVLAGTVHKVSAAEAADLAPEALYSTVGQRLRATDDDTADFLKRLPALDDRIAGNNARDPYKYLKTYNAAVPTRHFYPKTGGTGGFCKGAQAFMERAGCQILLRQAVEGFDADGKGVKVRYGGQEQEYDIVVWALDTGLLGKIMLGEDKVSGFVHKSPMVLYYFLAPPEAIIGQDYIQNFDPDFLTFRISRAGIYSEQRTPAGHTYICVEVITPLGSDLWERPEDFTDAIWAEARATGMVDTAAPEGVFIQKTPVSYKHQKVGFQNACDAVTAELGRRTDRILVTDPMVLGYAPILEMLDELGIA